MLPIYIYEYMWIEQATRTPTVSHQNVSQSHIKIHVCDLDNHISKARFNENVNKKIRIH